MLRKLIPDVAVILCFIAFYSCSDDQAFTIGDNLVDIKSNVIVIDTSTINTYTVRVDSVKTSGFSKALAGRYTDGNLGTITASSYFQIALPSSVSIDENAKYDSICVLLKPNGYCYGDSTKHYPIQVHKLSEDLENDDITYRYNTSKVAYDSEVLGSKISIVKPSSGKILSVKLSDTFGQELFNIILNEGDEVESQDNFLKYLKGLALTPDETSESSIMQFDVADSISVMRLYYHIGREEDYFDFKITNTSLQYNRIEGDYSNSELKLLKEQEDVLSSVITKNESYCQNGTGVMTRLEFPYLKSIFETYSTFRILSAELIIKPVKSSYNLVPLPESLYLYSTNTLNDLGSAITNTSGDAITPTLIKDNMYNETAYYFDVTNYISYMMQNLKDDAPALLLSLPTGNAYSLDRLMVGNFNHSSNAIRLKITYWKY